MTPEPLTRIPRDIYKHPAVHVNHGVRCVDCNAPVLDTPRYRCAAQWRCAACGQALQVSVLIPVPLPSATKSGLSPVVDVVVAHLRKVTTATFDELAVVVGKEIPRIRLRKSMEASNRIAFDRSRGVWTLR